MSEHLAALEVQAVKLLATRDYGGKELARKLARKVPEAKEAEIAACIADLQARGWLDEARFVAQAVSRALERGEGPMKVRHKLRDALLAPGLLDEALTLPEEVWVEAAQTALEKKFGDTRRPAEPKALAKRLRFLQGRGFAQSQCWAAMQE